MAVVNSIDGFGPVRSIVEKAHGLAEPCRRYFGIERSAGALRFPFNSTEDFAFFS